MRRLAAMLAAFVGLSVAAPAVASADVVYLCETRVVSVPIAYGLDYVAWQRYCDWYVV